MRLICSFVVCLGAAVALLPLSGEGFTLSGHKWNVGTVPYYINPENKDIPAAEALEALKSGAAVWAAQAGASTTLKYAGTTTGKSFDDNNKNEVFFRDGSSGSLVAETYRWYDAAGVIFDSDIAFYDASFKFIAGGTACSGAMVIDNFAAHEFGHMLGLSHSKVTTATMYPASKTCATAWLTLDKDDINGIENLYPPAKGSTPSNAKPAVAILTPVTGLSITVGTPLALSASATDAEDGSLAKDITWTDSEAGTLGTGAAKTVSLTVGTHKVTAKVTDSAGASATDSVTVVVVAEERSSSKIALTAEGFLNKDLQRAALTWTGATGAKVEIYRNGTLIATKKNSGSVVDAINATGSATYTYKVCERDAAACSAAVKVVF